MKRFWAKIIIACILLGGTLLFFIASISIPDLNNFEERRVAQSTKIYDRTGKILLYDVHGQEKRTVISLEEIPRHVKNATIALEDTSFYQHYGVRPLSILRAFIVNIFHGSAQQGGSTITQQLVKKALLTDEKTILRKFKEIIIALKLERVYSKNEILNFYLNQIPYGGGAYGIEAAAETFFGKRATDLTPLESAYLASLPKAPSYYSPYGKHRKDLDDRAIFTINRMRELGFLTDKEYEETKNEKIKFSLARTQGIIAPHFVIEVRDELNKRFGEDIVETGGFKIITTLDVDLQQKAEEVIDKYAETNEKNFNNKNEGVVSIDPKTGDILAMVGSRNYFDIEHEGNFNISTAHRQPGSAFKPFVYATAFKKGYTPETTLFDLPTEFNPSCTPDGKPTGGILENKCYHPQNFDNKFRGPISMRKSLAQSLNVPSVKVLYLAGINDSLNTARDFGITSLNDPARYGLTLVLGGGEVSLLELTSAYGVFANDGVRNAYRYILKISDASEKTVFEAQNQPQEVIDQNIARSISDILSDDKSRDGQFPVLYFPNKKVAAKTGTTNDYRDAWAIGYTPNIAIGAWSGNNDNTPMEKRVAGFIVAPWWREIMEYAISRAPMEEFIPSESLIPQLSDSKPYQRGEWRGGKEFTIDKLSGKLATDYTPQELKEKKVIQEIHSILYWIDRESSQFKNWEEPIRAWAQSNGLYDQNESVIPSDSDNIHVPENFPRITKIQLTPEKNVYEKNDIVIFHPIIDSKYGVEQVDYFANDEYLGSVKKTPYEFALPISRLSQDQNMATIKMRVYDLVKNVIEQSVIIKKSN